ncbi:unnamed protein product, partial [Prorocentrum cordatum]
DRLLLHYARGLQALRGEGPSPAPPGAGLLACAGGGADDASAAAYSVAGGPLPGSFAPPARAPPRLDGRLASEPGCPFWCERETKARQHRGLPRKRKASSASSADAPPGPEGGLADGRGPAREGAAALALGGRQRAHRHRRPDMGRPWSRSRRPWAPRCPSRRPPWPGTPTVPATPPTASRR